MMKRTRQSALLFMALCTAASPTTADTPPNITWLMKEPVSLFDLGMIRFNDDVERAARSGDFNVANQHPPQRAIAGYYYLVGRLGVELIYAFDRGALTPEQARKVCSDAIARSRTFFGRTREGQRTGPLRMSNYFGYFKHYDYEAPDHPKDLDVSLEAVTDLWVEVRVLLDSDPISTSYELVACKGQLMKPEVSFRQDDGKYAP